MKTTVHDCRIIDLPKISERKGAITPIYGGEHVPFEIARVYYLYDVPGGESRGGHAHKDLQQLVVSIMGAFDVVLDDGKDKKRVHLDRAYYGLYIPRMIWRELENFSSGGLCLVLASAPYDEADYIRDYHNFLEVKHQLHTVKNDEEKTYSFQTLEDVWKITKDIRGNFDEDMLKE